MTWKRVGGGTMINAGIEHPCDDEYENLETGELFTIYSTPAQHFSMPDEVNSIKELAELENVSFNDVLYQDLLAEEE